MTLLQYMIVSLWIRKICKVLIRNEDIEPNILDSLAKLYVKDAKSYEGLSLLQEVHVNFSCYKDILKVNQEIQRLLILLFSKEKINDISPLMLIDMFAKFKDFLPIGREGLDISLNFADYLMRVNLVAEAASFLEHLIKYKLHGKEKELNITKLANLYLSDNRYEDVIYLFTKYDFPFNQARYLQSRAFLNLGEYETAVLLLSNDYSDEANLIRADIFW